MCSHPGTPDRSDVTKHHGTAHPLLRITIRGRLSDRVAAGFVGMHVADRGCTTELVGELVDQAHLHGLLTRARDLGLDLDSVLVLDCPTPDSTPTRQQPPESP